MKIKKAQYVKGASDYKQCIVSELPQIAIAGKSNVGKSSFINLLVNDGKLARTSKLPGRTRLINYFAVDTDCGELLLADLPGYGFAKVSFEEKKKWSVLLEKYLANGHIDHVIFLVDIRHDPTKDDLVMYNYLFTNNLPFTVVATKSDKIGKSQVRNRCRTLASQFKVGENNVIAVSALNRNGRDAILERLEQIVNAHYDSYRPQEDEDVIGQ